MGWSLPSLYLDVSIEASKRAIAHDTCTVRVWQPPPAAQGVALKHSPRAWSICTCDLWQLSPAGWLPEGHMIRPHKQHHCSCQLLNGTCWNEYCQGRCCLRSNQHTVHTVHHNGHTRSCCNQPSSTIYTLVLPGQVVRLLAVTAVHCALVQTLQALLPAT